MNALIEPNMLTIKRSVAIRFKAMYCLARKKSSESKGVFIFFKKALDKHSKMINKHNQQASVINMANYLLFDLKIKDCLIKKFQKKTTPVANIFDANGCTLRLSINT